MGLGCRDVQSRGLAALQRLARLWEGECWWLLGPGREARGLFCLDGGPDLRPLRDAVVELVRQGYGLAMRRETVAASGGEAPAPVFSRPAGDCQVTVEERSQLFGLLKGRKTSGAGGP